MSHPVNDMIADQVIDQVASLQDHQVNSELMRLGVPGQLEHPLVIDASKKVISACEKFNKSCV